MKTKNIFFAAIAVMLAFGSCANDNDDNDDLGIGNGGEVSPNFTSSIGNSSNAKTRALGSSWTSGDAIGIYMVDAGQAMAAVLVDNEEYTTTDETASGAFTPVGTAITYPTDGSKVDFIAYYPYKTPLANKIFPVDVSIQTKPADIDFLYSNNAVELSQTTPNVMLNFNHKLTKVEFAITSTDIADLSGLTVAITGTKTKAGFDLAGGADALVADDASVADINTIVLATGKAAEAIILPAVGVVGRTFVFTLPSSGDTFTWEVPVTTEFVKGMKYTYNVKLQQSSGTVSINANATIIPWTDAPAEDITVEKDPTTPPVDAAIYSESFGEPTDPLNWNPRPAVDIWTGFDAKAPIVYSSGDEGVPVQLRATDSEILKPNKYYVWLPQNKGDNLTNYVLIVNNIPTAGYQSLKLSYDFATALITTRFSALTIRCNGVAITMPDAEVTAKDTFERVTVDIPAGTTKIEFCSLVPNAGHMRLDNLKIEGELIQ